MNSNQLRTEILRLVGEFTRKAHKVPPFKAGESPVPVSGRVYDESDVKSLVDSALDFWLTTGRFNDAFEKRFENYLGVRHAITTNSGSSANLLSVAALTSPSLGDRALKAGDEVITVAAGFPTTVNPLLNYSLVPVFVDVNPSTYNVIVENIEAAVGEKTRAIILAHTLGNPFDVNAVMDVVHKHKLWLIEDCCDALGSTYGGRKVGTFGDIGTLSCYPAHHITMGEGGVVFTNDTELKRIIESFRDWGRDCFCDPGKDNTCGKRFDRQIGSLPKGYDHKYTYSHVGFNLKITDMQAAVGLAQLDHLEPFIEKRKQNFRLLKDFLSPLKDIFQLPQATPESDPAWFGFPITIREGAPVERNDLMRYLNEKKIGTRQLFAGNITRQPYFAEQAYRVVGSLEHTDAIMKNTFWLGVYPGLTEEMLTYTASQLEHFVSITS